MRFHVVRRSCVGVLTLLVSVLPATAQTQPPLEVAGSEVLDVSLYTVPFYATDDAGRPVYDLQADEIALRVDGVLREVDSFDRWQTAPADGGTTTIGVERPPTRFVFLLFDLAFLSARGLNQSQRVASSVVGNLRSNDRLFVLTNHARQGFQQVLGPVDASEAGRKQVRTTVRKLRPNVGMLNPNAEGNWGWVLANRPQAKTAFEAMGANARAEYRAMAGLFAESLSTFADSVSLIREPKLLLVFSDGVVNRLYFDGESGLKNGSDDAGAYHGDSRWAGPIYYRFERALAKLAASGTVPAFVSGAGVEAAGRSALFHMGDASGGRFFENATVKVTERAILDATSAYYEAGFYPAAPLEGEGRVEVVVRRPGVRTMGPNRIVGRHGYRDLDALARRNVVVDLVYRGVAGQALGVPESMSGKIRSRDVDAGREVLFRPEVPTALYGKTLDLYEVMLAVDADDQVPQVLRYDRKTWIASTEPLELTATVPASGAVLWGVVAVEADSGSTYYRRLELSNDS